MITLYLLRKPVSKTLYENIKEFGTGSIMIDDLRIPIAEGENIGRMNPVGSNGWKNSSGGPSRACSDPLAASGRWPLRAVGPQI